MLPEAMLPMACEAQAHDFGSAGPESGDDMHHALQAARSGIDVHSSIVGVGRPSNSE